MSVCAFVWLPANVVVCLMSFVCTNKPSHKSVNVGVVFCLPTHTRRLVSPHPKPEFHFSISASLLFSVSLSRCLSVSFCVSLPLFVSANTQRDSFLYFFTIKTTYHMSHNMVGVDLFRFFCWCHVVSGVERREVMLTVNIFDSCHRHFHHNCNYNCNFNIISNKIRMIMIMKRMRT